MFALVLRPFGTAAVPCCCCWGPEDSLPEDSAFGVGFVGAAARTVIVAAGDGLGRELAACRKRPHCWSLREASVVRCR